jgi:CDGSH-type Zn-finger protein
MASDENSKPVNGKRIVVEKNGPYIVEGNIPLVRKTQVVSEHGEPLTWQKDGDLDVSPGDYRLCRCGNSRSWPFCDDSHIDVGFDGTETADSGLSETRKENFPPGTHILVRKDNSLCMESGFCGFGTANLSSLLLASRDTKARALVMAMVERCPSGALTYRIEQDTPEIETDLPQQIALTTEITSDGPIEGPLWVTGGIPIVRSDGQACETRNRVTLCNCGHSGSKPLCDGTHRDMAQREARRRRLADR